MKEQCQKIYKRPGKYNLQDIFSIIEDSDGSDRHLSLSNICDCLSLCVVGMLLIWIKNLTIFIAQSTDCELSPSNVNLSLEICCNQIGFYDLCLITFWKRKTMFQLQKCYLMVLHRLELGNEQSK